MLGAPVITPQNSETKRIRSSSAVSSNGKENANPNSRPNSGSRAESSSAKMAMRAAARNASRLTKPLLNQTIHEQKSSELLDTTTKCLSDEMDQDAEPLEPLTACPIALALRGADRDYSRIEGVLETKLSGKPSSTLKEMKDRIEEQKQVVKELRTVGKTLLSNCSEAEKVAAAFTAEHEAAAAKVEAERDAVQAQRDAANEKVTTLREEKSELEKRLNSAIANFAAVDEQRRATLEERDQVRAQLAEKSAAESSCRKELDHTLHCLAALKVETEQLRSSLEARQIAMDKEMSDMRESLGKEMVAAREAGSKLTSATLELTELRTKMAVADESMKLAKGEVARLESEKAAKTQEALNAERERATLLSKSEDMLRRLDEREAQHADAIRSLGVGQEMQSARIKELGEEREAAAAASARLRAELEAQQAAAAAAIARELEQAAEVRVNAALLSRMSADLDASSRACFALKAELAEKEDARQAAAAAKAVLEAECKVYREHAQHGLPEKLKELFDARMAADKENAERCQANLSQIAHANASAHMEQLSLSHASSIEAAVCETLRSQVADLTARLHRSEAARRQLHNQNQELRGNIRTFVRMRPAKADGSEGVCPMRLEADGSGVEKARVLLTYNSKPEAFRFDRAFSQTSTQAEVFAEVEHFVQSALDGYNVSLLAYGQTGAGKTWSMMGGKEEEEEGIIPRAIRQILQTVDNMRDNGFECDLEASFLEIYNEAIRDLLVSDKEAEGKQYTMRTGDSSSGCMLVSDLASRKVACSADVEQLIGLAEKNKTVKGTDMNERSSRSHTVFQLRIKSRRGAELLQGSLHLVDLAGSERLAKSAATGDRLKETCSINKSLSSLADVLTAIAKRQTHVPFRNSKLTYLLQPCFSGNGKAMVLMAVSPADTSAHETLCTLRFSSLISQCELGKATVNKSVAAPQEEQSLTAPAAAASESCGGKRSAPPASGIPKPGGDMKKRKT